MLIVYEDRKIMIETNIRVINEVKLINNKATDENYFKKLEKLLL